jgi:hypothetical protein
VACLVAAFVAGDAQTDDLAGHLPALEEVGACAQREIRAPERDHDRHCDHSEEDQARDPVCIVQCIPQHWSRDSEEDPADGGDRELPVPRRAGP